MFQSRHRLNTVNFILVGQNTNSAIVNFGCCGLGSQPTRKKGAPDNGAPVQKSESSSNLNFFAFFELSSDVKAIVNHHVRSSSPVTYRTLSVLNFCDPPPGQIFGIKVT